MNVRKLDPNTLFQQAVKQHQAGNIVRAIEIYRLLNKQYPKNLQVLYMLGTAEAQRGNFLKSTELLGKLLENNPNIPEALNNRGIAFKNLMRFDEALRSFDHALQLKSDYTEAHINRGATLQDLKRFGEALQSYELALQLKPDHPEAHNNRGITLQELERFDDALQSYDRALQLKPDYTEAHNNRGITLQELERFDDALESYAHALQLKPDYPETYNNRGIVLKKLERFNEALQSYDRALQLKPDYPDAYINRGIALQELKRFNEALQSFDRAIQLKPDHPDAYINRGAALQELRRFDEALQSFDRAIQLKPDHPDAYINRGAALQELRRFDEALQSYDRAIQLKPDYPEAHNNQGIALLKLKRLDEALQSYELALQLRPDNDFCLLMWVYVSLRCCNWENVDKNKDKILNGIINNKKLIGPFETMLLTDSLDIQEQSAKIWMKDKCFSNNSTNKLTKYPLHDKIRLGYFSADFHNHATLHLMAEMFEKHDRSRYEIYGFSFGPESNDPWRQRSQQCFDLFFDVRFNSDQDIAEFARNLQIDIAIDLKGFTENSRPNIFAGRAAPIQVNYLGYPGTMGAEFIDYIIADKTIIPEDDRHHYTEKVVYLPDCYQVNCRVRDVSQKIVTRAELHLPQDNFVFCCFNNNNKITPTLFDSWMRILRQVDDSVLWLFESNKWAVDHLRSEAKQRGVNAERLVFAPKIPIEEHLNRIRNADLFLDTLPYNAHTTASDALRMGVPLITFIGNAFAGRVAASLLKTLDLSELITHSVDEYEKIAVDLAINRDRLKRVKEKLNANIQTSPLFDSKLFTRHIEKAYELMYERYQNDLPPHHIFIES